MTNHSTVLCTPAHRDTSPTLKGSWSHAHHGFSLCAHMASHGNLEPSPRELTSFPGWENALSSKAKAVLSRTPDSALAVHCRSPSCLYWHCSPGTSPFTTSFLPSSAIGCQAVTGTLSWAVFKHNSSLWLRPCVHICVPWNAEWLGCHLFLAKWRALEERNSIAEEKLAVDIKIKRGQPCSLVGYTALGMWQASRRPARSSGND